MTIREFRQEIQQKLAPIVGEGEARAMANIILEDAKGYTPTQLVMYADRTLLDDTVTRLRKMIDRIAQGQPLQYVIGKARFRGRDFSVNEAVLIPRPETGQLVDLIIDQHQGRKGLTILDIGTGSGCISISLALDMPYSDVYAIDISKEAVLTAKDNARSLHADVDITVADAMDLDNGHLNHDSFDIIVSNPPYILESERKDIDPRVKEHEPQGALFVSDSAPIEIYTAISKYARTHLSKGGRLYFEINPLCDKMIEDMLKGLRFENVMIERDYKGNKRFAIATQP